MSLVVTHASSTSHHVHIPPFSNSSIQETRPTLANVAFNTMKTSDNRPTIQRFHPLPPTTNPLNTILSTRKSNPPITNTFHLHQRHHPLQKRTMRTRSQRNLSLTAPSAKPPSQPLTAPSVRKPEQPATRSDKSESCDAERILQLEQLLEHEQHRHKMLLQRHTALRELVANLVGDLESRATRSCEIWEDLVERVDNIVQME